MRFLHIARLTEPSKSTVRDGKPRHSARCQSIVAMTQPPDGGRSHISYMWFHVNICRASSARHFSVPSGPGVPLPIVCPARL